VIQMRWRKSFLVLFSKKERLGLPALIFSVQRGTRIE